MSTRIIINEREIRSPVAKFLLGLGALTAACIIAGLVFYVLLPIIGVVVTLSAGLFVLLVVASAIGSAALLLGMLLFGWVFGKSEIKFIRFK